MGDDRLQLVGNRQENQVSEANTVNGGNEGDSYTAAELARVGKIFHHMDQAEHRTQNADGGRIAAGRFPYPGCLPLAPLINGNLDIKYLSHFQGIDAIDDQAQRLGNEWVLHFVQIALQAQQPLAPCRRTPAENLKCGGLDVFRRRRKYPARHFHATHKGVHAALQKHRTEGADHHHRHGGRLNQRSDMAAFQRVAEQYAGQRERKTGYACPVQACSLSLARKRAIA